MTFLFIVPIETDENGHRALNREDDIRDSIAFQALLTENDFEEEIVFDAKPRQKQKKTKMLNHS